MADPAADRRYPAAELRLFTQEIFRRAGVPDKDAALAADSLVDADLRGVESHGIGRLLVPYLRRLESGLIAARPRVETVRDRPSTALLDGGNGLGQVVGARAMALAVEKARATGAGWVGVRASNHFGAAGYYARMAIREGMIGIVATNGPPSVAPWGGRQPVLSTNPLAVGIPAGQECPVVLDMATTVVSRGRIMLFARRNVEIPAGWALDEEGRPTNNPHAALRGTLQPLGGYKGYGLSLVIDLLSGVLTGAAFGRHFTGYLADYDGGAHNVGSLFAAVSVDSFMDGAEFEERVDAALREVKESARAPGFSRIYTPGEIEEETCRLRLRGGIPLPDPAVDELSALGNARGVRFPLPLEDPPACA